jgi:predicted TIM-barrel fold metal-dependent hydrolase
MLFDGNCQLGLSDFTVSGAPTSVAQLTAEMDHRGIAEALVYHASAAGYNPGVGNATLAAEISGIPRLHGCWVVFPHHTGEMPAPDLLVEGALAAGIRAVRMFPVRHRFLLADWSANELLEKLNEHRLPLFLDYERTHWSENVVDYDSVFRICKDFPALPLILIREGIGSTRYLYPLLEKLGNLHIEISYYQPPGGLEDISNKFGAKHLLFGTGLPTYEAGPVISMLLCSDISSEEKRLVAGDNLRSLLSAVRL